MLRVRAEDETVTRGPILRFVNDKNFHLAHSLTSALDRDVPIRRSKERV